MAGEIKIRIGAVADRTIDVVFGNIEKRALKVRDTLNKAFGAQTSKAAAQIGKEAEKALGNAAKAGERAARKLQTDQERAAAGIARAHEKAQRDIERALAQVTRATEREAAKQTAATDRETRRQIRIREKFAERTSQRTTRFLFPAPTGILSGARRIGGDILRGAGVDMSIAGGVSRAVSLQGGAIGLANQERINTGQTRGAAYYASLARDTGDKRSVDPEQIMNMVRAFTGKTGDFEAASKIANPLASLGTASGANMDEMGDAAGYVYNQLRALPDAGNRTIAVMRGIIGQTAVGAVEMKDYATQMGRIAANANKFEGSIDTNIMKMSALAQLSIESGGATSAADAARSVGAFGNTFGKSARIKAFDTLGGTVKKGEGVSLFTDKSETTMRDPFAVVIESIKKTKGNIPVLANMFADTLGRKPVNALANTYKQAGGGEAGEAAVRAQLGKYMNAQLSESTEKKNNEDFANSAAAKAQRFQNNLDKVVASAADKVFPALEKLATPALALAESLGKLTGYVAENPIKAVITALILAIGRAGLESALRSAIERKIMGAGSFLPGQGIAGGAAPAPGAPGFLGSAAGRGMAALAAGAAGYSIGSVGGQLIGGEKGAQTGAWGGAGLFAGAQLGGLKGGVAGAVAGASFSVAEQQYKELQQQTAGGGFFETVGDIFSGNALRGTDARMNADAKRRRMEEDAAAAGGAAPVNQQQPFDAAALSTGVADGISARTLKVQVMNAKDFSTPAATGPRVDAAGRAPR